MKKSKILMPLIGVASVGAVVAPIATLTSCSNKVKVLSYDEAKEWVKANYGETSTFVAPKKAVSSWDFSGEIGYRKTMTVYTDYKGYIKNHLSSFFNRLGQMGYDTAKTTITTGTEEKDLKYYAKTTTDFEVESPTFTTANFMAPLCEGNFDDYLNTYFYSTDSKRAVSYVANGKTLIVSGTMSSITENTKDRGYDIFAMPDCTLTFEDGKLVSNEFSFKKNAEAEYFWLSYASVYSIDFFHFTIDEGGKISFKYTYAAE